MTLTYSGNLVRQQDNDRFLLSLFAPYKKRPALWALFAFNYEIAKTRDVVSDTTIGLIRLQWWREAIGEIYEGKTVRQHEVLEPLAKVIKEYDLPQDLFNDLIYAREFDLEGVAPANLEGLINYCNYTSTPLFKLALKILGEECNDTAVVDISTHYALVGVIRSVPYMLKQQRIMLPQDILSEYKVSQEKLFNFKETEKLSQVIKEILKGDKAYRNRLSNSISSKFLKKVQHMTKMYEGQLKAVRYDALNTKISLPLPFLALRLWVNV